MKPTRRSRDTASIARKRALVRTLIERSGWAEAAAAAAEVPSPHSAPSPAQPLAEIIPFPRSEIVRR